MLVWSKHSARVNAQAFDLSNASDSSTHKTDNQHGASHIFTADLCLYAQRDFRWVRLQ